jgi:hypothetical protein
MKIWLIQVLVPGLKILGAMLANPAKRFLMVMATLLLSFLLFSSTQIFAQPPAAPVPSQSEPGDRTYTRNLFSGVFAFVSSVGILVLICMPSRKNS